MHFYKKRNFCHFLRKFAHVLSILQYFFALYKTKQPDTNFKTGENIEYKRYKEITVKTDFLTTPSGTKTPAKTSSKQQIVMLKIYARITPPTMLYLPFSHKLHIIIYAKKIIKTHQISTAYLIIKTR